MPLPITVMLQIPHLFGGTQHPLTIVEGLTTLIGPNGSGKTQVLHALNTKLRPHVAAKKFRYLSPGRLAIIEHFRSDMTGQDNGRGPSADEVAIGNQDVRQLRHNSSGITGDIMTIEERIDIRIKVEARLQALFNRKIILRWSQRGLIVDFKRTDNGSVYAVSKEASGLLHLISILTALFDDNVGVLLLDEPEVSLHPQLQAYVLREAKKVAGDPSIEGKKLIVISTHSPSFLQVRQPKDMTSLIFFQDSITAPKHILVAAPELQSRAIAGLLARMGESHRVAFFAQKLLLVEGPSDEIIANALAIRLNLPLDAVGTQIVPVIGKGEINSVRKLFQLMGKECVILADLDAFVDDSTLISGFYGNLIIDETLAAMGHRDLRTFSNEVRSDLRQAITDHYGDFASAADQHPYVMKRDAKTPEDTARARAATAALLSIDDETLKALPNSARWMSLRTRMTVLLNTLELGGCFVLRRGALESYTLSGAVAQELRSKPEAAVAEADLIAQEDVKRIRAQFSDIIRALDYCAKGPQIDEVGEIRKLLLSIIPPCLDSCSSTTSKTELDNIAFSRFSECASLFSVENVTVSGGPPRLRVNIKSKLFAGEQFPIELSREDLYKVLDQALPRSS